MDTCGTCSVCGGTRDGSVWHVLPECIPRPCRCPRTADYPTLADCREKWDPLLAPKVEDPSFYDPDPELERLLTERSAT